MAHDLRPDLDQFLPQRRQCPVTHRLGQHRLTQEVAQIVGFAYFAVRLISFGHSFTSSIPSHRPALARRAVGWESLAVTLITAKISMQPPLFGKTVSGRFYGRTSSKRGWIEFADAAFISKAVPTNSPQGSYIAPGMPLQPSAAFSCPALQNAPFRRSCARMTRTNAGENVSVRASPNLLNSYLFFGSKHFETYSIDRKRT